MTGSTPSLARARALLELGPDPTHREIVQAFRRQARALHPDVSAAADAAGRFGELTAAYRVALAHVDDSPEADAGTARSVAVRHVQSPPVVSSADPTSPLVWVGPAVVVPERRPPTWSGWLWM